MQHCAVPDPLAGCGVWGIEQCLHLISHEIGNQPRVGFLEGDRQDTADLIKRRGLAIFKKAEERLYGSQPNVACLRRVSARVLQMLEEVADQAGVELFQGQRRWCDLEPRRGELE